MGALKGRQGRQRLLQSQSCISGEGSLCRVTAVPLPACVPVAGPWLSVVPAHVERIRARKDMFFPPFLEGGSRGPGDSPEILSVWTALLPFLSISQAAWEMRTICWQPQTSSSQPAQKRSHWRDLSFPSWSPRKGTRERPGLGAS